MVYASYVKTVRIFLIISFPYDVPKKSIFRQSILHDSVLEAFFTVKIIKNHFFFISVLYLFGYQFYKWVDDQINTVFEIKCYSKKILLGCGFRTQQKTSNLQKIHSPGSCLLFISQNRILSSQML